MSATKRTVVFDRPFELATFDEILPAGEYEICSEVLKPLDWIDPGTWAESVLVHLHPRQSHPGLSRTLTIPLAELEDAIARDKLSGKPLTNFFLEEMLSDPMIRQVMQADGVTEADIRELYAGNAGKRQSHDHGYEKPHATTELRGPDTDAPRGGSVRPGIGE